MSARPLQAWPSDTRLLRITLSNALKRANSCRGKNNQQHFPDYSLFLKQFLRQLAVLG
jgi:hypothetical protein